MIEHGSAQFIGRVAGFMINDNKEFACPKAGRHPDIACAIHAETVAIGQIACRTANKTALK